MPDHGWLEYFLNQIKGRKFVVIKTKESPKSHAQQKNKVKIDAQFTITYIMVRALAGDLTGSRSIRGIMAWAMSVHPSVVDWACTL